jgi:hypothetical protein
MDSDTFPSGERRSERGVAHKMQPRSAVAPTVTAFDIATSKYTSSPQNNDATR